jgi:hypothetical protein
LALEKASGILALNDADKVVMYDLVGNQRNFVPLSLPEYIMGRVYMIAAFANRAPF